MGCTESLPDPEAFRVVHAPDRKFSPIGVSAHAGPSTVPLALLVKEKLFSWSGNDFKIKHYPSQELFGNGVQIQGKTWAVRDAMALLDGNGNVIAVCMRKFEFMGETFKIYTPSPALPGQFPSQQKHFGKSLYTYCQVKRSPMSYQQEVYMEGENSAAYVISRSGGLWPKTRTVRKNGKVAALMQGGTWESGFNSYKITINPGIDPCLIVCFCAVCDAMDED
ncbi:LURP-one-related [Fragilaria crotonensis]|nr:LURP-one-related [Fragilaria crotonensis]